MVIRARLEEVRKKPWEEEMGGVYKKRQKCSLARTKKGKNRRETPKGSRGKEWPVRRIRGKKAVMKNAGKEKVRALHETEKEGERK